MPAKPARSHEVAAETKTAANAAGTTTSSRVLKKYMDAELQKPQC
jgi:hypothetical protein